MSTVKLNSIKKTYPNGAIAVRGVDMVIENSEFIVFVGPSGCCLLYTSDAADE